MNINSYKTLKLTFPYLGNLLAAVEIHQSKTHNMNRFHIQFLSHRIEKFEGGKKRKVHVIIINRRIQTSKHIGVPKYL